jgi:hypothetical protein
MKMDNYDHDHNQSHSVLGTKDRTRRKRGRRWDAILVGIIFSIAFVLIITKVAQITPCEVINHFNIDTKACDLVGANDNSIIRGQLANQHSLGFNIINQYALLASEFSKDLMGQIQQFLQNVGLIQ